MPHKRIKKQKDMGLYVNPTEEVFAIEVKQPNFVDKSQVLSLLTPAMGSSKGRFCVSRPRRFGKSLTGSMITSFFSRGCNSRKDKSPLMFNRMGEEMSIQQQPSHE